MTSYTVGRGPGVDVVIDDEYASRVHARVWRDATGQVWVEDLGSTNGIWINGRHHYAAARMYPGDTLRIGHTDIPWH